MLQDAQGQWEGLQAHRHLEERAETKTGTLLVSSQGATPKGGAPFFPLGRCQTVFLVLADAGLVLALLGARPVNLALVPSGLQAGVPCLRCGIKGGD